VFFSRPIDANVDLDMCHPRQILPLASYHPTSQVLVILAHICNPSGADRHAAQPQPLVSRSSSRHSDCAANRYWPLPVFLIVLVYVSFRSPVFYSCGSVQDLPSSPLLSLPLTARIMRSLFRPVFSIHSSLSTPHESVTPIKGSLTRVFQCDSP
jgi:hypothetical protein